MTTPEICSAIKEIGMGAAAFAFMCWVVVYIVKNMARGVDKSTETLTLLNQSIKEFMNKVRDEHKASNDNQKELMEQHRQMIETLGRINGYKSDKS